MTRKFLILPVILFLLLLTVQPVAAHGYVIRSIPQDRTVLDRPPTRLQYWFSESLEPDFSAIHLRNQAGDIIASGGVDADDQTLLNLRVPPDLTDGAYLVELRPAFASDGHVIVETRVFFVGEEVGGITGQSADTSARPFEVIWKALLFQASYLMFGVAVVYAFILVPVWGNTKYPHGLLPPRVMRRLNIMMGAGLLIAVYANVIALLQQSMIFFNADLDIVLAGNLWQVVRVGSRFGDVWHFRMFMLVIIAILYGASLFYGRKYPKVIRSFWTANVWAIGLLIGAQAVTSHAAGSFIWPWVAIFIHWLHTVAVAFWVGGITALTLVLPVALAPYADESRWQALQPVMKRFSRYVVGTVWVVITSGIYSASNWFFTPVDFATTYGAALGYKIAMVGLLLWVGALHHIALRPRLLHIAPVKGLISWAQKFRGSIRLEAIFVIFALILAALLSATPIPEPEFLQTEIESPSANQQVGDYDISINMSPGGVGVNTIDVVLESDGVRVNDVIVEVQFIAPQRPLMSRWQAAEFADDGLYVVATDVIDETGYWQTLVDIFDESGEVTRVAFEWDITADAALLKSLPPSPLTWIAFVLVLSAVIFTLFPMLRWVGQQMEWTRVNVVVAGGIILMTIIVGWFSIAALNRQEVALQLQQNPPPEIINTVLPDAEAIAQGKTYFDDYCSNWVGSDDLEDLARRLYLLRDDELYQITLNGWRDLASCEGNLSEHERWQLVNYIRTLRER